jgi:hypothetical protein
MDRQPGSSRTSRSTAARAVAGRPAKNRAVQRERADRHTGRGFSRPRRRRGEASRERQERRHPRRGRRRSRPRGRPRAPGERRLRGRNGVRRSRGDREAPIGTRSSRPSRSRDAGRGRLAVSRPPRVGGRISTRARRSCGASLHPRRAGGGLHPQADRLRQATRLRSPPHPVAPRSAGRAFGPRPAIGSAGCGLDRSPDPAQSLRSAARALLPSGSYARREQSPDVSKNSVPRSNAQANEALFLASFRRRTKD